MYRAKNGYVGINEQVVFFTTRAGLTEEQSHAVTLKEKKSLGSTHAVIARENVASVNVANNDKCGLSIVAKGLMDDDIFLFFDSAEDQSRMLAAVREWKGGVASVEQVAPGLLARCGGQIVLTLCAIALTGLLYWLVTSTGGDPVQISGGQVAKKGALYDLATAIGPNGVLIVGGLISLALAWSAVKKSKQSFTVDVYSFS